MKETAGARAEVLAEVEALRALAKQYRDDADLDRGVRAFRSRNSMSRLIADALSFQADVLAQDAALVERMAQAIVNDFYEDVSAQRVTDSDRSQARAALAAMLQKEQAERVILTEDPTTGAIETAGGASTPSVDPATTAQKRGRTRIPGIWD